MTPIIKQATIRRLRRFISGWYTTEAVLPRSRPQPRSRNT